jgi:hypothetical protein
MNGDFNELYEEWVDHINSQPLTTPRIDEISDVININQQIINRIYGIRRHLEMSDDVLDDDFNFNNLLSNPFNNNTNSNYTTTRNFNNSNTNSVDYFTNNENNIISNLFNNGDTGLVGSSDNFFRNGVVSRLFSILLEGDIPTNYDNMEDVKVTLTNDQFNKLFSETITESIEEKYQSECNICMDEYKVKDVIAKLSCNHVFHKDCIQNWLCNERVTCPVCRKDTREELS